MRSMHTSTNTTSDEDENGDMSKSELHHQRILRAKHSFEQLKDATLAYATGQASTGGMYTPARLNELRSYIEQEMAEGSEALACVHLAALIYMSNRDDEDDTPMDNPQDPMTAYLAQRTALNYGFFHYGTYDVTQARAAASALFARFVRINREVRHDWTGRSIFVSPIQENAACSIELPNPAYTPVPTDALGLLRMPKRRRVEEPTIAQQVEMAAANDDFRAVQLHFFYEFSLMASFAEALDSTVNQVVSCDFSEYANNTGWMAGLFRDPTASRIIIPMGEDIHRLFLYPGDIRHMSVTLRYDDLSLTSPSVVASTIASDTYTAVAAQLVGNLPLLWAEMAAVSRTDPACEARLAWDVRAGVLLYHFYLLHITYLRTKADHLVLPISIYTLRRDLGSTVFSLRRFAGCLLLFRRRAYLCQAHGSICYEGYHAVEHGLRAWVRATYGEYSQLARVLDMVYVSAAATNDLPVPQTNVSEQTTYVPNSAYASTLPQGSIFSSGGT